MLIVKHLKHKNLSQRLDEDNYRNLPSQKVKQKKIISVNYEDNYR